MTDTKETTPWPWWVRVIPGGRAYLSARRDMAVRHARERAALTLWRIEAEHALNAD